MSITLPNLCKRRPEFLIGEKTGRYVYDGLPLWDERFTAPFDEPQVRIFINNLILDALEKSFDFFALLHDDGLVTDSPIDATLGLHKLLRRQIISQLPVREGDRDAFLESLQADLLQVLKTDRKVISGEWGSLHYDQSIVWAPAARPKEPSRSTQPLTEQAKAAP
jgi:hypothetical protein